MNKNVERIGKGLNVLALFGADTKTGENELSIIRACLNELDRELTKTQNTVIFDQPPCLEDVGRLVEVRDHEDEPSFYCESECDPWCIIKWNEARKIRED
jgi:hypothetical protein